MFLLLYNMLVSTYSEDGSLFQKLNVVCPFIHVNIISNKINIRVLASLFTVKIKIN